METSNKGTKCPRCGHDKCSKQHEGGATTTFILCHKCGYRGSEEAWKKMQKDVNVIASKGTAPGSVSEQSASSFPDAASDPSRLNPKRKKQYYRVNPEEEFKGPAKSVQPTNSRFTEASKMSLEKSGQVDDLETPERTTPVIPDGELSISEIMKFFRANGAEVIFHPNDELSEWVAKIDLENSLHSITMPFFECGFGYDPNQALINMFQKVKLATEKQERGFARIKKDFLGNKVFNLSIKTAREWQYTEDQKERTKDRKRGVFPRGKDVNKKDEDEGKGGGEPTQVDSRRFDTVDRVDHRSPDPKEIIPGYEKWHDKQVDKYYDGWVKDHIENSGGSVPGSNTEKFMNLDGDERAHAPVYPTEAPTEKLLETRHVFNDDYEKKVASRDIIVSEAALKTIIKKSQLDDFMPYTVNSPNKFITRRCAECGYEFPIQKGEMIGNLFFCKDCKRNAEYGVTAKSKDSIISKAALNKIKKKAWKEVPELGNGKDRVFITESNEEIVNFMQFERKSFPDSSSAGIIDYNGKKFRAYVRHDPIGNDYYLIPINVDSDGYIPGQNQSPISRMLNIPEMATANKKDIIISAQAMETLKKKLKKNSFQDVPV